MQSVIERADRAEIVRIDPWVDDLLDQDNLAAYTVLQRRRFEGEAVETARQAFRKATEFDEPVTSMLCFIPHHGIRFQSGDDWVAFVVCFECAHIYYRDSTRKRSAITPNPKAQALFDALLEGL